MNWKNLKKNKCPQCNQDMFSGSRYANGKIYHPCGFTISERRYAEIVSNQIKVRIERENNPKLPIDNTLEEE